MSDYDDVGVIIVAKRAGGAMLGSIGNPPNHIWTQRRRRRSRRSGISGRGEGGKRMMAMRRRKNK